ncbi:MAG: hypothetical protein ACKV2T_04015 [Kofleriaceae bacterium]
MSIRLALLLIVALSGTALADVFEFLAYTPPSPKTWTKQVHPTGAVQYTTTANGGSMIMLVPSVTPIGTPTEEFETYWRANVEPIVKASLPTPQSRPARDMTMVWGSTRVTSGNQSVDVQVVMFVGRGSVLGTVTLTSSAESVREVAAFNASVKILDANRPIAKKPDPPAPPAQPAQPAQPTTGLGRPAVATPPAKTEPARATPLAQPSGGLGFDYAVPPGYSRKIDNGITWLFPDKPARDGACAYGLYPPLASSGDLEKDVESAIQTVPAGWEKPRADWFLKEQKGVSAAGWSYWYKSASTSTIAKGNAAQSGIVMALGFWAPNNHVSFVYGFGGTECLSHEVAFERLFHSIQVKGWTSDGGKAYRNALHAGWRYIRHSPQMIMLDYAFYPSGRYQSGRGMIAQLPLYELTYTGVGDGTWKLDGSLVTITPDAKNRDKESFRVRVTTENIANHWRDAIVLLRDGSADMTYYKILEETPKTTPSR